MGIISETFRLRPGVLRSRHPFHPVAAYGARAVDMLRDHELSVVPDGPETPYGRLITQGGWVLHIGCDLDTLTLLHTVEAELDLPFLRELEMNYVDALGEVQTLQLERCPGGHRGGVLKFDRLFREEGAMTVGRIGQAVCRLISAPEAAAIMRRKMSRDPSYSLDDNPFCADCTRYRGKIKAARLAIEDFVLTAPLWSVSDDLERALTVIQGEGIFWVEVDAARLGPSPAAVDELHGRLEARGVGVAVLRAQMGSLDVMHELCAAATRLKAAYLRVDAPAPAAMTRRQLLDVLAALSHTAEEQGVSLLLGNRLDSLAATVEDLTALMVEVGSPLVRASYDPAGVAMGAQSPFYGGLYKGLLRRFVRHVELRDAVAADGRAVPPGRGNAEVKEIISNLRCRSFDGFLCLWPLPDRGPEGFRAAAEGFWEIMDSI
jgi:sugar phosphate isomerase/epimerase